VWWTNTTAETFEVRQLRADLLKDTAPAERDSRMPEAGFFKLEQGIYRQRVVADIVHELLNRDVAKLGHLLRMVLAMTSSGDVARDPGRDAPWVVDDEVHSAQASILRRFVDAHRTVLLVLPHQPLATLTAESNNMGMLAERAIDRGIKFHGAGDQLSVLVFDRRLVLKEQSPVPDTFIRIPVSKADDPREDEQIDEISALLRSLQGLEAMSKRDRRQTLTDIPRVVAGMFLAATQDAVRSEKLGLNPGEFLECEGANRLTQLVGLQRRTRYTRRVAAVRDWLTQIKLHRQLVDFVDGRRVSIERSFPIVQRLDTQITLETELPSSLERVRTEIGVWRLEPTLWKMRTHDSGAAGFMLLDSRAFHISTESSEPFNLYWAIVQRAYNDARDGRVDEEGVYTPYAKTLYEWAGMRLKSDARHFQRVRERMHDHLKLMVDHGLLCDWSCPELEHPDLFSKDAFKSAKVELKLPTSLAQYLPSPRTKSDSGALTP